MKPNKNMIAAGVVCLIALVVTGSSWFASGGNDDADLARKSASEIAKIHERLAALASEEDDTESKLNAGAMEVQMELSRRQDLVHLRERELEFERQQLQERIKAASSALARVEEQIRAIVETVIEEKRDLKALQSQMEHHQQSLSDLTSQYKKREQQHTQEQLSFRKHILEAENNLRRIKRREERARELLTVKRQALLMRLEQLEGQAVGLEPTDRLRDVERKLDGLRREVDEIGRAQERRAKDMQKKSE